MGNFDWSIIIGPLVGAVIGYCTNFIAVKMLFRPLNEKKIGNFKIPFTPGMIPKEKPRLAKAVGEAVGNTLLTEETIANNLLTDEIKDKISSEVTNYIEIVREDDEPIKDKLSKITSETDIERNIENVKDTITEKLYGKIVDMKVGKTVAEQVSAAIKSKLEGGLFAMMLTDDVINSFMDPVSDMIDSYIVKNGRQVISEKVVSEVDNFVQKPTGELTQYLDMSGIDIPALVVNVYTSFMQNKLSNVLGAVNIPKIIEDKINEMDVLEAEELLLSVMKKELNAIVNLGALIGFILGIVMIFV